MFNTLRKYDRRHVLTFTIACCGLFALNQVASAQTWTQTSAPTQNWSSIACSASGSVIVAVANPGRIYSSTNGGLTWVTNAAPLTNWNSVACSADGRHMIAAVLGDFSGGGGIYISTNSGSVWQTNTVGAGEWYAVASSADGSRLAASMFYPPLIFNSTNGGQTWVTNVFPHEMVSLHCSVDGSCWMASGTPATLAVSTNNGVSWSTSANWAGMNYALSIAASADRARWVATAYQNILTSTNLGATWNTNPVPSETWQCIASSADGSRLIACSFQHIYTSTNFGISWVSNNLSTISTGISSVASSADGSKLVAAMNGGGIWVAQNVAQPGLDISNSSAGAIISWIVPSTNFLVQQSFDLASWSNLTNIPVINLTNLHNEVTLWPSNDHGFYRLMTP